MIGRIRGARHVRSASTLLALLAGVSFAGAAAAQGANPFAFLFGGSQSEGRSAYAPTPGYAPRYAPVPSYSYGAYGQRSYGYSALPGYSDPYDDEGPAERHSGAEGGPHGPTPQEVMAAIKAVRSGKGPLGPFINDPTLRVGDVVVTTKGLMVYRGGGGPSHREGDFVSVSNASGLVANKQTLISLEKASRLTPQKPLGVETKPSRQPAPEVASSATPKVRSAR